MTDQKKTITITDQPALLSKNKLSYFQYSRKLSQSQISQRFSRKINYLIIDLLNV